MKLEFYVVGTCLGSGNPGLDGNQITLDGRIVYAIDDELATPVAVSGDFFTGDRRAAHDLLPPSNSSSHGLKRWHPLAKSVLIESDRRPT